MTIAVEPGLAVKERRGFWAIDLQLSLAGLGEEWGFFWFWVKVRHWGKICSSR